MRPFARCEEEVSSIAYSSDGTLLALGHQGGGVRVVRFSAERKRGGKLFARDGKWWARCGSRTINLWHVQPDGLSLHKTLRGHAGYVPSIAFAPMARAWFLPEATTR